MTSTLPTTLSTLLAAPAAARDRAWAEFLETHSRLLLYVARSFGGDHDAAMDRYTVLLDQLQRDDFRRLRTFAADGRSEFTTWLVVVAQRICLDQRRALYGRARGAADPAQASERAARRRLADLAGVDIDALEIEDPNASRGDDALVRQEATDAVNAALAELPPHDRLLLQLRYADDVPVAEIASIVGYPSRFQVYRRLDQALASLRAALAARGISPRDA